MDAWNDNRQIQQAENKLSELTDRFAKIHNDVQVNKRGMERKNTEPKLI